MTTEPVPSKTEAREAAACLSTKYDRRVAAVGTTLTGYRLERIERHQEYVVLVDVRTGTGGTDEKEKGTGRRRGRCRLGRQRDRDDRPGARHGVRHRGRGAGGFPR
jgi:hypothetical protein